MTTKEKIDSLEERLQIIETMLKSQGYGYGYDDDYVSNKELAELNAMREEYRKNPSIAVSFEQVLAENGMSIDD
ncbi:MAG: hypothetical protein LBL41_02285 [Bifidobacteriaceae bacterium]|jgi:hypothetical protein|nr:hypothetical protein [Bifidobacteriaceae bacterium]